MGIKDRRTKILLSLYLLSNDSFKDVFYSDSICSIFDLRLNRQTRQTFETLVKAGLIASKEIDQSTTYTLASGGFEELCLTFPCFRFNRISWDSVFRILSYEIPEEKRELRDKLRREVSSWGLGPWHRSFWITPHPIIPSLRRLVSDREEEQYVQAFEATHVFGDSTILIEKVWGIRKLESTYRALFKTWHSILSEQQDKSVKMTRVVTAYVGVLRNDPGLPKKLVGEKWIGFEATALFREIRDILMSL